MTRLPRIRSRHSLRAACRVRSVVAALVVLAAQLAAPPAQAGDDASCPATARRAELASAPAKLAQIQKRILAEGATDQRVVALPSGGYAYPSTAYGSDAALLEFEVKQGGAESPKR